LLRLRKSALLHSLKLAIISSVLSTMYSVLFKMKAKIHPTWFPEAKIVCACGNTFTAGATVPEINVEVCSACHPFYTGQMKFLDTAGRVDAFKAKMKGANAKRITKTEKRKAKKDKKLAEEAARPESLAELRSAK
jgi:large subunit ribosomal protein L31